MNNKFPPRFSLRFLHWFCPASLHESVEGDLLEQFEYDCEEFGFQKAKRKFTWNVIRFFRPGIVLRNRITLTLNNTLMIGNYFKVALRVMTRNKTYSTINILGLTLGLSSAILLFLWIQKEFTYDQFHTDKERLFVAWNRDLENGEIICSNTTPRVLAPTI